MLVLAPTRELAVQIKEECDKFGASSDIKNTVVYGGVPKFKQVAVLKSGVEIVIGTPGRLIDHVRIGCLLKFFGARPLVNILFLIFGTQQLEQGNTNLKRVTYLVLDEGMMLYSKIWSVKFVF